MTWIQASTLRELLDLKAQHPDAKLVVGNTEIGKGRGLGTAGGVWEGFWALPACPRSSLTSPTLYPTSVPLTALGNH